MDEVMLITREVAAYTAGLLEKASFTLHKYSHNQNDRRRYWVEIRLSIHVKAQVEYLQAFWGAQACNNNKYSSRVRWTGQKAIRLAHETLPYLIAKRNHALVVEEMGKLLPWRIKANTKIDDKVWDKCEELHKIMGALNDGRKNQHSRENLKRFRENTIAQRNTPIREVYHDNIFDFFDGFFTEPEAKRMKSMFDDLIPKE